LGATQPTAHPPRSRSSSAAGVSGRRFATPRSTRTCGMGFGGADTMVRQKCDP
jgi:hypothetical protein